MRKKTAWMALAALLSLEAAGMSGRQTAAGYSSAALNGNYAFTASGIYQGGAGTYPMDLMATIHADGNGHLGNGRISEFLAGGLVCNAALTGSYTIGGNGTGSALLAINAGPGVCASNTFTYAIAVNRDGSSFLLAETDQIAEVSGLGIRQ